MLRTLLIWGMVAGLCAGLVGGGFAQLAGEPALERAVAFEAAHAGGHEESDEVVSRTVQSGIGLFLASCLYGVALGGIFALVFAGAYGRISRAGPVRLSLLLAGAAFVVVYLVAFVKYPPNPPAIGDPTTIGERTALYFGMVAISVLGAIAALRIRGHLATRLGSEAATLGGLAAFAAVVIVGGLVLPSVSEVPSNFPATTLSDFRMASLGVQLVTWATIGAVFAAAARRTLAQSAAGVMAAASRAA